MSLPSLYEISNEYQLALSELTDLNDEAVFDTLEALKDTIEVKCTNITMYFSNLQAIVDAKKKAESNMATSRKVLENKIAYLRKYLKDNMERTGVLSIENPEFRISIANNPPKLVVTDEDLVPTKYFTPRTVMSLDKKTLKEDIGHGADIKGAYVVQDTRLVVK